MKRGPPGGRVLQRVLNARQFCLKLIANVTYGYAAAGFSGRMPMAELADAIVQVCRTLVSGSIWFPLIKVTWERDDERENEGVLQRQGCCQQRCVLVPVSPFVERPVLRRSASLGRGSFFEAVGSEANSHVATLGDPLLTGPVHLLPFRRLHSRAARMRKHTIRMAQV